jgi:peptidoglycan/LPS O-acetylase OafA/YrhL
VVGYRWKEFSPRGDGAKSKRWVILYEKSWGLIEISRGLAALAVVISHGSYAGVPEHFWQYIMPLGSVAFFFAPSGFIIFYVHVGDIGLSARAANYAWRRLVRIFPTYWLVLLVDLSLHLLVNNRVEMPDLRILPLLHEMLLLPGGKLYVYVAWTLRHELLFYGLFLILILNLRVGLLLFAGWLVAILYVWLTDGWVVDLSRPSLETVTNPMNLCFFVGIAIAALSRKYRIPFERFRAPDFSYWLGAISYPLYLSHLTVYLILAVSSKGWGWSQLGLGG